MAEKMEIDVPVTEFLAQERKKAPKHLQEYYMIFEDLYERKLWHQLTTRLEEFVSQPESGSFLVPLYQNFVSDWAKKMNKLKLVSFALSAAAQFQDFKEAIDFLSPLIEKVNTPETQDAYVLAIMEVASFRLLLNDLESTKEAMDSSEKILEGFDSVETIIHASFYRVSAQYFKAKADFVQYYKNALLFLACVNLDDLSEVEKVERAYDLSLAALLGETIYNFGELLMHPILSVLKEGEHEWLYKLLFAVNAGDIGKFEALSAQFSKQPLLESYAAFLRQKICLMSLIESIFKRSADNRRIPFADISTETKLPIDEVSNGNISKVEHLVMKGLSLNLIRGSIDQVEQYVHITWVQSRYMDLNQIDGMKLRLNEWSQNVDKMANLMQNLTPELFIQ
ncbi:PCI-domain-containing protein [Basidiobolus meristosporus CBS 931.73]|uniref:PCI-domain-containing protein n=1 Tax=Basidiobolus meristosporus CBS 931.73 TaxID=1314790 RepID=A0A1Y1Y6K7_9FUNG|nr:PCI-domain-containing protein [Basidiobolus meristosporus CBS 931.73]|eukprot:ORX93525.1 PCI-domain-containing protein [Basidiobolus meristosporus CBS 931.73]